MTESPMTDPQFADPQGTDPQGIDPNRRDRYIGLIEALLHCPNGQEPDVLDAHADLIDAGLIQTMMQVATAFAHQNNQDGSRFLIFVARELTRQLGLYPEVARAES